MVKPRASTKGHITWGLEMDGELIGTQDYLMEALLAMGRAILEFSPASAPLQYIVVPAGLWIRNLLPIKEHTMVKLFGYLYRVSNIDGTRTHEEVHESPQEETPWITFLGEEPYVRDGSDVYFLQRPHSRRKFVPSPGKTVEYKKGDRFRMALAPGETEPKSWTLPFGGSFRPDEDTAIVAVLRKGVTIWIRE